MVTQTVCPEPANGKSVTFSSGARCWDDSSLSRTRFEPS